MHLISSFPHRPPAPEDKKAAGDSGGFLR